jgi:hypothetical protein
LDLVIAPYLRSSHLCSSQMGRRQHHLSQRQMVTMPLSVAPGLMMARHLCILQTAGSTPFECIADGNAAIEAL